MYIYIYIYIIHIHTYMDIYIYIYIYIFLEELLQHRGVFSTSTITERTRQPRHRRIEGANL